MINLKKIELTVASPASINRRTGVASELKDLLLNMDEGEAYIIRSDSDKEHKAAQRNVNVIMKHIKKLHQEMAFVTRTVGTGEEKSLWVYRIEDIAA